MIPSEMKIPSLVSLTDRYVTLIFHFPDKNWLVPNNISKVGRQTSFSALSGYSPHCAQTCDDVFIVAGLCVQLFCFVLALPLFYG